LNVLGQLCEVHQHVSVAMLEVLQPTLHISGTRADMFVQTTKP